MLGHSMELSNHLRVSCDWLRFTVTNEDYSVDDVIQLLGFSKSDFTELEKGANGYKSQLKLDGYPVFILYNGNQDMGIHVSVSGTAIGKVIEQFKETLVIDTPFGEAPLFSDVANTYFIEFLLKIRSIGHFSRIDLAIDDIGANYFSMSSLESFVLENRVVSKFRSCDPRKPFNISTGEVLGYTLNFGSRSSDIFLRVYDKKLEQNSKLERNGEELISYEWVRWELELKNSRANEVIDKLIGNQNMGCVTVGVLSNYFRVIDLDDSNRSRCSVNALWDKFLNGIAPLSLYVPTVSRTLEEKKEWVRRQVMPTLAGIILADGGSLDIITENFDNYVYKMSRDMQDIVKLYNPEYLEVLHEA